MEANAPKEPLMCTLCSRFYGNPATHGLCSSCSKKQSITAPPQLSRDLPSPEAVEQTVSEEGPSRPQPQADSSKCFSCRRKVGMLGFKCRCEKTFCKVHRMPEEHECRFDFSLAGKAKLKQENPLVRGKKIEQI